VITVNYDCSKTDIPKFINKYPNQDNQIEILHCYFAMADANLKAKVDGLKSSPVQKRAEALSKLLCFKFNSSENKQYSAIKSTFSGWRGRDGSSGGSNAHRLIHNAWTHEL
jgi:hypothetical protein